jgi:hypothetical protein
MKRSGIVLAVCILLRRYVVSFIYDMRSCNTSEENMFLNYFSHIRVIASSIQKQIMFYDCLEDWSNKSSLALRYSHFNTHSFKQIQHNSN